MVPGRGAPPDRHAALVLLRRDLRPYLFRRGAASISHMEQADFPYTSRTVAPGFPPPDVIAELLRLATLAPSMHNSQPWRFRIRRADPTIELYPHPSRMLRDAHPHGPAVHL